MPAPIPPGLSTRTVHDFRAVSIRAFVPRSTYDDGEAVLIFDGEDGSTLAIHMPSWLPKDLRFEIERHPGNESPELRRLRERIEALGMDVTPSRAEVDREFQRHSRLDLEPAFPESDALNGISEPVSAERLREARVRASRLNLACPADCGCMEGCASGARDRTQPERMEALDAYMAGLAREESLERVRPFFTPAEVELALEDEEPEPPEGFVY